MKANPAVLDHPVATSRKPLQLALGCVLFAALTGVGAAVSFPLPFSPVPVTLQTLFVVLAGAMLGPVAGPASQLLYVAAGAAGLPVFAGGAAGLHVLAGPTGGYLAGFVVGAWISGLLLRPGASWLRLTGGLLAAHAAIFVFGISQLMIYTGNSLPAALTAGFVPFLPGLTWKTAAAVGVLRSKRITGWFRS